VRCGNRADPRARARNGGHIKNAVIRAAYLAADERRATSAGTFDAARGPRRAVGHPAASPSDRARGAEVENDYTQPQCDLVEDPRMGKEQVVKTPQQVPTQDSGPVVRVEPSDLVQTVYLGANHRLSYHVDNLRAGSRVTWHHDAKGARQPHRVWQPHASPTSQITEFVSHPGDREIDTSVDIDGRREATPTTTLRTPEGLASIVERWGQSERGRLPVAHTMQQNEDLVLRVKFAQIDASVEEVTPRFTGRLGVKESRKVGDKEFEVVLTPSSQLQPTREAPADASGKLTVVPRRTDPQSVLPIPLTMRVQPGATRPDDHGSRPGSTQDAIDYAVDRWREVYLKRMAGLADLMGQLSKKDPIPEPPLWERLLKGAALVALNAVTAGIGQKVVDGVFSALGDAPKEAVKVFLEGSSAALIEGGVSRAMAETSKDPSARRTSGGTLLSPDIYFERTQREALRDTMLDHVNRVRTSLRYMGARLDQERPGAGYRAAIAAFDAINNNYALAADLQFAESLQAWCTFSAQARLGTGDPNHGRDLGTELGSQVDVKKILPGDRGRPPTGLDKPPGVLRLELAEIAPGHMIVARSSIDGFDNDTVVQNLHKKVDDLRIPIVARFNESKDKKLAPGGFVISRNENGAILADSTAGLMQEMFGGRSDHDAARHIFEHQIAQQKISPERG
jgi:hypothetical protein